MLRRTVIASFLLLVLAMSQSVVLHQPACAQGLPGGWSEPTLLLNGPPNDNGTNPIVYTGPSNNTHLLYFGRPADDPKGPIALYYARWGDGAWTSPVDVLVTPDNALPPTLAAVEDSKGDLHVIWNTNAVWHAKVALAKATDPHSWQTPVAVYGGEPALEVAAAIDSDDNIHLVVSTASATVEYVPLSPDGSSGQPVQIHGIVDSDYFPYRISLVATAHGRLLTCWAETSSGSGGARGVWCSSSEDKGDSWAAPEMIASGHRGVRLVYFPVTDQVGRIIWGGLGVGGRDLQLSRDNGGTWSTPIDLTQGTSMEGYTGQVAVMDSAEDIHVLINPGDGNYMHVRTKNGAWLPHRPTGWQASDWIEMAVAEGNTLVVVYWMGGNTSTSHMVLDAPKIVPLPVVSPEGAAAQAVAEVASSTVTAVSTFASTPTATPTVQFSAIGTHDSRRSNQTESLLLGIAPAVALVVGVVIFQFRRRRA